MFSFLFFCLSFIKLRSCLKRPSYKLRVGAEAAQYAEGGKDNGGGQFPRGGERHNLAVIGAQQQGGQDWLFEN